MRGLADPESTLDASNHQVAHHLAGDAGSRGQPADDLAIAGIDSKQHTHDLAITTGELEVIGAPADVRAQCNHDAIMRAPMAEAIMAAAVIIAAVIMVEAITAAGIMMDPTAVTGTATASSWGALGGHSHGRYWHGGRWWNGYGVDPCWRWTPAGYVWVCN